MSAQRAPRRGTWLAAHASVRAPPQADRSLLRLGRRAAGLAHDLGKPLFVVEHVARRALRRALDPAARGDVETLLAMAAEMRGALRDFLHELRREPVPEGCVPLGALVARALDVVGPAHGRARVRLRLDREAALAPAPERLVRPLVNLLENALLAAPSDSRVELRAWLRRDALCVEVADRGPGLAAAVAARAFALAHAPAPGRAGIGLAASRDLLRDLGGRLDLASVPARGTRARLAVPRPPGASARERRAG